MLKRVAYIVGSTNECERFIEIEGAAMELKKKTKINGEFNGWEGESVYELLDGSKWQQAKYKYKYKYKYMPNVKLWKDGSRYYLEVEGMSDKIEVQRVS